MIINIEDNPTCGVVKTINPSLDKECFAFPDDYDKYLVEFNKVKDALYRHYVKTTKVQSIFEFGSLESSTSLWADGMQIRYRKLNTSMAMVALGPDGTDVAAYALTAAAMRMYDQLAGLLEMRIKKHVEDLATINPMSPKTLEIPDGANMFNELRGRAFSYYYERNRPKQITPENRHFSITDRWEETNDEVGDPLSIPMVDVKFYDWTFSVKSVEGVSPVEHAERIVYAWERIL